MASTPDQTSHPLDKRLTELKDMLKAREGKPEYKASCAHIRDQIDRLEKHRIQGIQKTD